MDDLRSKVVSGASWFVVTQWALRLSGLVSTAVLARVLTPADFGTVAAILALVAVTDAFFEFSFGASLIKDENPSREHFDTVWTLRIIKTFAMGAAVLLLAPLFADYAQTGHIVEMALVVSTSIALKGFQNVGLFKYSKELDIVKIFQAKIVPKLLGVATNIALALYLRSFWALIYGQLALTLYTVGVSYWVSDYRPKLCLSSTRSVWSFSKWLFIKNLSRQLFIASDRLILSGLIDKTRLGTYTVSASLASIFSVELFGPAGQILMPAVAKLQNSPRRLSRVFLQSTTTFIALVVPAGTGVWLVSDELALVVLGSQWDAAGELLALFAIFFTILAIAKLLSNTITMLELNRFSALLCFCVTATYLMAIYPVFNAGGIKAVILLKIALVSVELLALLVVSTVYLKLSVGNLFRDLARIGCSAAVMALAVPLLPAVDNIFLLLLLKATVGATLYASTSFVLWKLQGSPVGFESLALEFLHKQFGRLRPRPH